jgi:hypothetical protein
MFPITKEIYDQILSQDLSHNNGGSTYWTLVNIQKY